MTVRVTKRYAFFASHRLHSPGLSDAENQALYGKCNNPCGHGHNYEVELTVAGRVDERTGRVMDLAVLDRLAEAQFLAPFRYRNLNEEVELFRTVVPTTENLAAEVARRLRSAWPAGFGGDGPRLENVSIRETPRNICNVADPI